MTPPIATTRAELRTMLGPDAPGFVATMGALHAGHQALIERSALENARTVVSVFVNPTQFQDPADLARYPRDLDRDGRLAAEAGADLIFAPAVSAIYPPGAETRVEVGPLTERWEGASRPSHFRGVATVVAILLNLVRPARTYFGEKDYQQLQVVKRLHADLALPGEIVGCATVREADGLALSSRNARLSQEDRQRAGVIPRALGRMAEIARSGEPAADAVIRAGLTELEPVPELSVDYLAVVDGATLEPLATIEPGARVLFAGVLAGVRLIDNRRVELMPAQGRRSEDGDVAGD